MNIEDIPNATSSYFGMDVYAKNRSRTRSLGRHIAIYLMREYRYSVNEIADHFDMENSSVVYATTRIKNDLLRYKEHLEAIKEEVGISSSPVRKFIRKLDDSDKSIEQKYYELRGFISAHVEKI